MTEQERQVVIEKAVRARTMAINGLDEDRRDAWSAMEAALEAVGYFDMRAKLDALVEAGEEVAEFIGAETEMEWAILDRHCTALNQAKDQSHD